MRHESYEWSLYSTSVGIGTAITAAVGAAIADSMGFAFTFILVSALSFIGCSLLFSLEEKSEKEKIKAMHMKREKLLNERY